MYNLYYAQEYKKSTKYHYLFSTSFKFKLFPNSLKILELLLRVHQHTYVMC